jgi:hypothetical protein
MEGIDMFEMIEISQGQLIETGLNIAGYLAASALAVLVYASVLNRKIRKMTMASADYENTVANIGVEPVAPILGASSTSDSVAGERFTLIDSQEISKARVGGTIDDAAIANTTDRRYNRNRSEVIRLAREMLAAGNPAERVTDLLPVTESEMQLIQLSSGNAQEG